MAPRMILDDLISILETTGNGLWKIGDWLERTADRLEAHNLELRRREQARESAESGWAGVELGGRLERGDEPE